MRPIYSRSIGYSFLLHCIVNPATRCHYRHITTRGLEHLPGDGPVILAPCHQNALMDPLVLLKELGGPIVFLARADIFRKPVTRAILTFLRIMPAYRIRDGRDQLGRNAETFDKSVDVLLHNVPLCLMAEGTHNDKHQLRPLVKGMFRIAGEAWKALNGLKTSELPADNAFDYRQSLPLYIVPVGMDYDEYEQPYSSVCIEIGQPIDVRPFMRDFVENEPVALNHMRDALAQALKTVMHHATATERYDDEYAYCHLATQDYLKQHGLSNTPWNRFQARKNISQQLASTPDESLDKTLFLEQGATLAHRCRDRHIPLWFASKGWTWWKSASTLLATLLLIVGAILALPIQVFGFQVSILTLLLANPIVFLPTHLLTHRIIQDPQFRSSINYGIRLGLHILYFSALFISVALLHSLPIACLMLCLGLLSAFLLPRLFALLRDTWYHLRMLCHRPNTSR